MKRHILFSIILLLIVGLGIWFVLPNNNNVLQETSKINLSYQEVEKYSPDTANIVLGVETIEKNINTALNKNHKKIDKIKDAIKNISGLEVSTANYRVQPEENKIEGEKVLSHRVTNLLNIKTANLKNINKVLKKSLTAGANSIVRIEYDLKNRKEVKEKVIEKALTGIQNKAKFITKKLGKKNNNIISLNVNDNYGGNIVYQAETKSAVPRRSGPGIEPKKIKIEVNIRATYRIY